MSDQRRYSEEEVRKIFEVAAQSAPPGRHALSPSDGLTLEQLQEIGREVGMAPERIEEAAVALDLQAKVGATRKHFGVPISVSRTVDLPRAPTDREWEQLVATLRETFGARGRVETHGGLRQWTNGNLHAFIEPTEKGHRLRLGTLKGNAIGMSTVGLSLLGMGLLVALAIVLTGKADGGFYAPLMLGLMGLFAVGSSVVTLPGWARERGEQMDYIVNKTLMLLRPGSGTDSSEN